MEGADVFRRQLQRLPEVGVRCLPGRLDLRLRHPQIRQLRAVKAAGVVPQRLVAPGPDRFDHVIHRGADVRLRLGVPAQQPGRVQFFHAFNGYHDSVTSVRRRRSLSICGRLN